jgi:hypothetical protein
MSQLSPFVRAFRSIATELTDKAQKRFEADPDDPRAWAMQDFGECFYAASVRLEQQIAQDLVRMGSFQRSMEE